MYIVYTVYLHVQCTCTVHVLCQVYLHCILCICPLQPVRCVSGALLLTFYSLHLQAEVTFGAGTDLAGGVSAAGVAGDSEEEDEMNGSPEDTGQPAAPNTCNVHLYIV